MKLSFDEWYELAYIDYHKHLAYQTVPLREGQFYFNHLFRHHANLATEIQRIDNVNIDPFYRDSIMDNFIDYCRNHWDEF